MAEREDAEYRAESESEHPGDWLAGYRAGRSDAEEDYLANDRCGYHGTCAGVQEYCSRGVGGDK